MPGAVENGDFLDGRGFESRALHGAALGRVAGADAAGGQRVERLGGQFETMLRAHDGVPGREVNLFLAEPIGNAAEPDVENDQGNAGDKYADRDRNNILARQTA